MTPTPIIPPLWISSEIPIESRINRRVFPISLFRSPLSLQRGDGDKDCKEGRRHRRLIWRGELKMMVVVKRASEIKIAPWLVVWLARTLSSLHSSAILQMLFLSFLRVLRFLPAWDIWRWNHLTCCFICREMDNNHVIYSLDQWQHKPRIIRGHQRGWEQRHRQRRIRARDDGISTAHPESDWATGWSNDCSMMDEAWKCSLPPRVGGKRG